MVLRPWRLAEAWWACGGALLLVGIGAVSPLAAWRSLAGGVEVYLFLAGMMLLAEIARAELVFDWMASRALRIAVGSPERLFALVFALCTVVTIFLSNDATVVVLTPAVIAIARRAAVPVLPYAYPCAFVANAASFVLPISNPANLVVYGGRLPALGPWIATYGLASLAAIGSTYVMLRWILAAGLKERPATPSGDDAVVVLRKRAVGALVLSAVVLIVASWADWPLGIVTAGVALVALAIVSAGRTGSARALLRIDYSILFLVAGLFVIVGGLDANGALVDAQRTLAAFAALGEPFARIATAAVAAILSNLCNNLPIGVLARYALATTHQGPSIVGAAVVGIDLGPNLSVTGSLATLLWLSALRAESIGVSAARFLRAGLVVMPVSLVLTVLSLRR